MPKKIWFPSESAAFYDFNGLITRVRRSLKKKYPEITGDEFDALLLKSLKTFTINNQTFDFERLPNQLGGFRWYVKCPKCGTRCFNLYLPTGIVGREQKYYCKQCHKLRNASLLMGDSRKYQKVYRPLKRLEFLKKKLMKKNMTPEKATPLLNEYQKIEAELVSSPEYRLWKFQKEHEARA